MKENTAKLICAFQRNELIMIPIPKPKFFERKVPSGQSEDDYFDQIIYRQSHVLRDAIDRVSNNHLILFISFI